MKALLNDEMHPVRAGMTIEVGDYGYFEGHIWRRLGNIKTIRGYRVKPEVNPQTLNENVLNSGGRDQEVNPKLVTGVGDLVEGSIEIKFSSKSGYYIQARMCNKLYFESTLEIKRHLEKLVKAKIWKSNYCVVTSVAYALTSFAAFSKEKGSALNLGIRLTDTIPSTDLPNLDLSTFVVSTRRDVEIVERNDPAHPHPLLFECMKLSRDLLGRRNFIYCIEGEETDVDNPDATPAEEIAVFG